MTPHWFPRFFFFFALGVYSSAQGLTPCQQAFQQLGASYSPKEKKFQVRISSSNATDIELLLFKNPHEKAVAHRWLTRKGTDWETEIQEAELRKMGLRKGDLSYGFRVFGPNAQLKPGKKTVAGWVPNILDLQSVDDDAQGRVTVGEPLPVDRQGNRMNPFKLIFDPRAVELTDLPKRDGYREGVEYRSGPETFSVDTETIAPKGVLLRNPPPHLSHEKPTGPLKDDVIYETHVRGFTMSDATVPAEERGTFLGVARKASYLKAMGYTAVSLMPVHEFQDTYWGYAPLSYFALKKSYATKKGQEKPGGIVEEFAQMCDTLHAHGIKVIIDVVYNHTGEGGAWGKDGETSEIYSYKGLDNQNYYQVSSRDRSDGKMVWYDQGDNGCGPNFNTATEAGRREIVDSMVYLSQWVDGFRGDLGSTWGNTVNRGDGFHYDKMNPSNALNRILHTLKVRPPEGGAGWDFIVEPWSTADFQLGDFPSLLENENGKPVWKGGWAEWNAKFRDAVAKALNKKDRGAPSKGELAQRLSGSSDLFQDDGRKPWHSINMVTSHDGPTLIDLFSYNGKQNESPDLPVEYHSDGGFDGDIYWDQKVEGETKEQQASRQRQAARNTVALLMLSFGVPMMAGGDEVLSTKLGNNNTYANDNEYSWQQWPESEANESPKKNHKLRFRSFVRNVIHFRHRHPTFHPVEFATGHAKNGKADTLPDLSWYSRDGKPADFTRDDSFLGYRLDADDEKSGIRSIYVAFNWDPKELEIHLPAGKKWYWAGDTDTKYEGMGNFIAPDKSLPALEHIAHRSDTYLMGGRSVAVFVEKELYSRNSSQTGQ